MSANIAEEKNFCKDYSVGKIEGKEAAGRGWGRTAGLGEFRNPPELQSYSNQHCIRHIMDHFGNKSVENRLTELP